MISPAGVMSNRLHRFTFCDHLAAGFLKSVVDSGAP
jgi:hypothetical protein